MTQFVFDDYAFDSTTGEARFQYSFDDGRQFYEVITFPQRHDNYDQPALERALFLAFVLIGTSYFKTFPTASVHLRKGDIDQWQADFLNKVYGEGLSQFAYENQLMRADLAWFEKTTDMLPASVIYRGDGILALQSGGKDSLLTAALLQASGTSFVPWYISTSSHHPLVLDDLGQPLVVARRRIDSAALSAAAADGAKNGHVPVTYIVQSLALLQAILLGKQKVLVSIAHEGEEPHAYINELPVMHQWSKTWQAEQLFSEYVTRYISADLKIGSPLRSYSELRVAELFVQHAWQTYGQRFSSCNRANYGQGSDNSQLRWCGECPKCANSFLLFAPFLDTADLTGLFAGQDLFAKPSLQETFKGLLGVDDVMKPFECIGEIDELRYAYHRGQTRGGYTQLSFAVPATQFDYRHEDPAAGWARFNNDLLQ